jgi:hypothetical protein
MKTDSNETNVDVAWCPFVAFRIAIRRGRLQTLRVKTWRTPKLALWRRSSRRARLPSLRRHEGKRKGRKPSGSLWG